MNKDKESHTAPVIEIGAVSVLTQGNGQMGPDAKGQLVVAGLADD